METYTTQLGSAYNKGDALAIEVSTGGVVRVCQDPKAPSWETHALQYLMLGKENATWLILALWM